MVAISGGYANTRMSKNCTLWTLVSYDSGDKDFGEYRVGVLPAIGNKIDCPLRCGEVGVLSFLRGPFNRLPSVTDFWQGWAT